MAQASLIWKCSSFGSLYVSELYEILNLRQDVFLLEQKCLYPDIDSYDQKACHLTRWEGLSLMAYARIFNPGIKYTEHAIGRVAIAPSARGKGLGIALMREAMTFICKEGPKPIRLSAQEYLADTLYSRLGFHRCGDVYDEDGIPHVEMLFTP